MGPLEFKLVAPMPEQMKSTTMYTLIKKGILLILSTYFLPECIISMRTDTSGKCIVVVLNCFGMGATQILGPDPQIVDYQYTVGKRNYFIGYEILLHGIPVSGCTFQYTKYQVVF